MQYVSVPKDLSKVKSKVFFNLTKRQIICFGSGALIGIPLFFMLRQSFGSSTATLLMIISMMPFFLLAMYEKNGQPLERYLHWANEVIITSSEPGFHLCAIHNNSSHIHTTEPFLSVFQ